MKNVHVRPTDEPSSIWIDNDINKLVYGLFSIDNIHNCKNQNIYITSDEEIKEDDWVLSKLNEVILFGRSYSEKFYKKIILTTDQDLIADGIQAIDDEFLEWFVKNPSCESVDTIKKYTNSDITMDGCFHKIIIPKEETKQESIEEAAERLFPFTKDDLENRIITIKRLFWIDGTKWQQERSFTREDIENIWNEFVKEVPPINNGSSSDFLVYLKQFKKKC